MLILLDIYGVIIRERRVSNYLYKAFGRNGLDVSMKSLREVWRKIRVGILDIEDLLGRKVFKDFVELHQENEGFKRFLEEIKERGIDWGIQSNIDKRTYEELKKKFGWNPKYEFLSWDLRVSKPDPLFYEEIKERVGDAIIVDDNPRNVKVAKKVGLRGIVFKNFEKLVKEL